MQDPSGPPPHTHNFNTSDVWIFRLNVQRKTHSASAFSCRETSFKSLHICQVLKGAVVVTLCQNEAEVKCHMEITTSHPWESISIWNFTSASFWQRFTTTAPFKDWLLRKYTIGNLEWNKHNVHQYAYIVTLHFESDGEHLDDNECFDATAERIAQRLMDTGIIVSAEDSIHVSHCKKVVESQNYRLIKVNHVNHPSTYLITDDD